MLVDGTAGEPERDHTLKRFPTWGDAADLIDILNVRPDGDRSYVSVTRDNAANRHRGVVEGSQMLAQAIVAAGRHAPGRRVVSASMVFMRAANTAEPLRIQLDELSGGRNFTTLAPHVRQAGKLCASGIMLLDATAPDVIRHAAAAPDDARPRRQRALRHVGHRSRRPLRRRRVHGRPRTRRSGRRCSTPGSAFARSPKTRTCTPRCWPSSPATSRSPPRMRPHAGIGQNQAHRTLSTAINAINISFHADVRADRWMLYRHHSTFAGDGMTHSECRVYNERRRAARVVHRRCHGPAHSRPIARSTSGPRYEPHHRPRSAQPQSRRAGSIAPCPPAPCTSSRSCGACAPSSASAR